MSKLWGGRFSKTTDSLVEAFTKSIDVDYKLAECDVIGSLVHVSILAQGGYLTSQEFLMLSKGLNKILKDIRNNIYEFDKNSEDIHSDIQNKLQDNPEVKDLVSKLHTARSRNDQVVFSTKLYCKLTIPDYVELIDKLIVAMGRKADEYKNLIIPGFTHLQHAQPVYLKDHLGAYIQMLFRDKDRLLQVNSNIKLTLGAGALAGTPIRADLYIKYANKTLKKMYPDFEIEAVINSLDSVSDRDFVIEIISALSILNVHLSRMAEDLILWSTKEFDFVELDDAFCTGSSLMPHKKNPDVLELIRGYTGRLCGNLVSVLTMMKGLPLTYNRDMQLDKEPLFNSFETIAMELKVLKGLMETLKFNEDKIIRHLDDESLYATDLVYYLVGKGVAFKDSHRIIGELIRYSNEHNMLIKQIPEKVLKKNFSEKIIKSEIVVLFDPKVSVDSKKSIKRAK